MNFPATQSAAMMALERESQWLAEIAHLKRQLAESERQCDVYKQYDEACDREMEEARGYIPPQFFGNDSWTLAVQRLTDALTAAQARIAELERELAAAHSRLVLHGHRVDTGRNEGQSGMPQGDCECSICRPFYRERDDLHAKLAEAEVKIATLQNQSKSQ